MRNCEIEKKAVNSVRVLSAEAIQKANSGHPGLPLGAAPMAFELFSNHLKISPANPNWADRDRFVLSAGHGSAMLYSLLHLFGYGLSIEDLKNFRQLGSLTPGHPEYGHTKGVDATTGPLGAGLGMAVGMALAEKHLAAIFNKEGYEIVNHNTFALCGDGCMMEGISSEALSFAGTMGLNKLTVLYDSNRISIEGSTDIAFTEDVEKRVQAFGFKTLTVEDGNDLEAIGRAIDYASHDNSAPYFIIVKTVIGYGCKAMEGTAGVHGSPLGEENIASLKEFFGMDKDKSFHVSEDVYEYMDKLIAEKEKDLDKWNKLFNEYKEKFPEMAKLWDRFHDDNIAKELLNDEEFWKQAEKAEASRASSGALLNHAKDVLPNLFGGSADLGPSNKSVMNGEGYFSKDTAEGKNIHFGVRELAMTAIGNGILLHGGLRSYVSTFFVFSDYTKPMARLSALMKLPQIFIFTHDSIGVGEDGPTHEPIEQMAMLRAMPDFHVVRPCDRQETAAAWYMALSSKDTPTALVLTRQGLRPIEGSNKEALKGGYVIDDTENFDTILIASGSEVALCVDAKLELEKEGYKVRVVSMPSMDVFEEQSEEYKESVLPKNVRRRVAVEALSGFGWEKYTGLDGAVMAMNSFGASGPAAELFKHFGFTVENLIKLVKTLD